MTITKTENGGEIILALNGWLDTLSSTVLDEELNKIEKAGSLILDFENVEYIASSGLRRVVAANIKAKELGASFSVINTCDEVMSIFKMTGLDKKFNITAK